MDNKLVDYRNRKLNIGDKVRIKEDIPSVNGMLHKDSIVKINEHNIENKTVRVTDSLGKIWWVSLNNISASFL